MAPLCAPWQWGRAQRSPAWTITAGRWTMVRAMRTSPFLCMLPLAAGCSALDPIVGRVVQPPPGDADTGVDVAPGVCDGIGPDEVCFARDIRPLILRTSDAAKA